MAEKTKINWAGTLAPDPRVRWQDSTNVVLGLWLLFAPGIFPAFASATSSYNAWIVGFCVVTVALWALEVPGSQVAEWTNVTLGFWLLIAPFVVGFAGSVAAWNAYIVGALIITFALVALPQARFHPPHDDAL